MPNNSQDLINLLIEERKRLQLTQYKLSKKVDVAHTSVARIENGEMNPTLSLFISIANELGYDLILKKINGNQDNLENDDEEILQEQSVPVKKLTPPKK